MRILIVDGDAPSAKLIEAVLEPERCHLRVARTAKEALIAVMEFRPELMLVELSMPDLPGLDLIRLLKADTSTAAMTIVAVTASNGPETQRLASLAGCADYIRKPIDVLTFAARLKSVLGTLFGPSITASKRSEGA
jgi:DNA-binding response OmpR family regulator